MTESLELVLGADNGSIIFGSDLCWLLLIDIRAGRLFFYYLRLINNHTTGGTRGGRSSKSSSIRRAASLYSAIFSITTPASSLGIFLSEG